MWFFGVIIVFSLGVVVGAIMTTVVFNDVNAADRTKRS